MAKYVNWTSCANLNLPFEFWLWKLLALNTNVFSLQLFLQVSVNYFWATKYSIWLTNSIFWYFQVLSLFPNFRPLRQFCFVGLFPVFVTAAMNVRSALLTIYETHFVPLGPRLRPCLNGFLSGILSGLEENSDHLQRWDIDGDILF